MFTLHKWSDLLMRANCICYLYLHLQFQYDTWQKKWKQCAAAWFSGIFNLNDFYLFWKQVFKDFYFKAKYLWKNITFLFWEKESFVCVYLFFSITVKISTINVRIVLLMHKHLCIRHEQYSHSLFWTEIQVLHFIFIYFFFFQNVFQDSWIILSKYTPFQKWWMCQWILFKA